MSWMFNEVEGLHFSGSLENGIADFWCQGAVRQEISTAMTNFAGFSM